MWDFLLNRRQIVKTESPNGPGRGRRVKVCGRVQSITCLDTEIRNRVTREYKRQCRGCAAPGIKHLPSMIEYTNKSRKTADIATLVGYTLIDKSKVHVRGPVRSYADVCRLYV